jgi:hypothetical protein
VSISSRSRLFGISTDVPGEVAIRPLSTKWIGCQTFKNDGASWHDSAAHFVSLACLFAMSMPVDISIAPLTHLVSTPGSLSAAVSWRKLLGRSHRSAERAHAGRANKAMQTGIIENA